MCAHMPSARTLALTACSGLPLAVLRASPTDLMCARVRPLAGLSWVLHSSRTPPRFKCKRTAINSLRCAQALRWCARPLSPVRAHVPLERLTIGPRVRPPIAATSSRASRAWRSSEDRAAKLTTLLWVALVAWARPRLCRCRIRRCRWPGRAEAMCERGAGRHGGRGEGLRPQYAQPACSHSTLWAWVARMQANRHVLWCTTSRYFICVR